MKVKPQNIVLLLLGFIGLTAGMLFSGSEMNYLFSRSVGNTEELATDSVLSTEEKDAIQKNIEALETELKQTTNDPEKALELRRKIQEFKKKSEINT